MNNNSIDQPVPEPSTGEVDISGTEDFAKTFQLVLDDLERSETQKSAKLKTAVPGSSDSLKRFEELLGKRNRLKALLILHRKVSDLHFNLKHPSNVGDEGLTELSIQVSRILQDFQGARQNKRVQEVLFALSKPHLQSLCAAYDDVSNRHYEPLLPEIPYEVDEDEGMAVKIVRLEKNQDEPLGATIKCEENGSVVIARVMKGGAADRAGCIQVGDKVVEVNGCSVAGKQPNEIVKMLAGTNGTVVFKLIPAGDKFLSDAALSSNGIESSRTRVKALFSYDPKEDGLHPCPEAGLSFAKGDILILLDSQDQHWWQAKHEINCLRGKDSYSGKVRVGLIPSSGLQEKRALARSAASGQSSPSNNQHSLTRRGSGGSRRLRRVMYETRQSEEYESDDVKTYEEVGLLYPAVGSTRTLVLIGAPGVGRNELKRRLLMLNPDRFGTTIPHTSRGARPGEVDGVDYHFARKIDMERWVKEGRFIEYGEYKGIATV